MATTKHTFSDIFGSHFGTPEDSVKLEKIEIPIIQRDYAQGRIDADTNRVRKRFLKSLYNAVTGDPITLDFVYGDIDDKGVMTPLDGQQRLTTLFLLHWFAAKKEQVPEEEQAFLERFSYETRYSARYFCNELTKFTPAFEGRISEDIINQAWFPLDWLKDPTIASMLVMIDAIAEQFSEVEGLWDALIEGSISFYFLPIKDMGLTDELYIKMNSRGKPLTSFEHFKAELERELRKTDETKAQEIIEKVDRSWTDLLWTYRDGQSGSDEDFVIDDEFLKYFKFVCDILCYEEDQSPQNKSSDEIELAQYYFSPDFKSHEAEEDDKPARSVSENIRMMESMFDCWLTLGQYSSPAEFLASFMSTVHEEGKIVVDGRYSIDIFEDCLHNYSDRSGRIRRFPLNRIVLLYAITLYLRHQENVSYDEFRKRIRIINNLIQNSDDELSDRRDRNNIPMILDQVDSIMLENNIGEAGEKGFNTHQLKEEIDKQAFLENDPNAALDLHALEDHPLLHGQVGIVGIDNLSCANRFFSLFNCDPDKVDRALMSIGDYSQQERNGWRYQVGSKSIQEAWENLFHRSANKNYENTRAVLNQLLESHESFSDEILDSISEEFIKGCEVQSTYPWRYYYVKYPAFRPGSYGKLCNTNKADDPYLFTVMLTKSQLSENSYDPYLMTADPKHISRDDLGQRLLYSDCYIITENDCYLVKRTGSDEELERIPIKQNDEGVDEEDRINILKSFIHKSGLFN